MIIKKLAEKTGESTEHKECWRNLLGATQTTWQQ